MSRNFEELDYRLTPIGPVSLRRRREHALDIDVLEIKLGDAFLMSSLFTASEIALARLAIDAIAAPEADIVVGGLGLGYTARAALETPKVRSIVVVEFLDAVVDWHLDGKLPLGAALVADKRCRFVRGDFFALAASEAGFDPGSPGRRFDAILLDIDHSPAERLDPRSEGFYAPAGLRRMARHLRPGGVFALWSNDAPDAAFARDLAAVFADVRAEPVEFDNPLQGNRMVQTVYLGGRADAPPAG